MTKFNQTLLAVAVAGAIALPGVASAASLRYEGSQQITFAKDLIVNNGTTIYTPRDLTLVAQPSDLARMGTVNGDDVTVKVTLTNGARFDSTAPASQLVAGFLIGEQFGAAAGGEVPVLVGTPYYSATGQELNFTFTAPGLGNATAGAGEFAITLNSLQVTNLVQGLFDGNQIAAEITAQNAAGQQILAARSLVAQSLWGLSVTSDLSGSNPNTTIDVASGGTGSGAFNRRTRFAPFGDVGGAGAPGAQNLLWSPGAVAIDITRALEVGTTASTTETYINNFSAIAAQPEYNVVATAQFGIEVKGSDLSAFANNIFLSTSSACAAGGTSVNGTVSADGATANWSIPASSPLFANVTNAPPSASLVHVCLRANGTNEMVAQDLSATVNVNYNLPTQRVNPPAETVALRPLRQNGEEIIFQNVNPGGNARAQSFLRITNNTADVCPVTIDAKDDAGRLSGEVKYTLPAHASAHFNSNDLENGTTVGTGAFGDGTGRWYVRVTAECDSFRASALNRNLDTGVVTNLTPEKGEGRVWLTPTNRL